MTDCIFIYLAVEDALSEAVGRAIVAQSGRPYQVAACFGKQGFGYLKKQVASFNRASLRQPFLVLTDLDARTCVPDLIEDWLPGPRHPNLLFRIAVREIESWVLADRQAAGKFLGVDESHIPRDTDALADPKGALLRLAGNSRFPNIRRGLLPKSGGTAAVGPGYNALLSEFVAKTWNAPRAAARSLSLRKTIRRIRDFRPRLVK